MRRAAYDCRKSKHAIHRDLIRWVQVHIAQAGRFGIQCPKIRRVTTMAQRLSIRAFMSHFRSDRQHRQAVRHFLGPWRLSSLASYIRLVYSSRELRGGQRSV